jgi:hypothetical protein
MPYSCNAKSCIIRTVIIGLYTHKPQIVIILIMTLKNVIFRCTVYYRIQPIPYVQSYSSHENNTHLRFHMRAGLGTWPD